METITDKLQIERLSEKNIVIENIYAKKGKEFIRTSDGTRVDQVYNAPQIRKVFKYKGEKIYVENKFNPKNIYTFAKYNKDNQVKCINCGKEGGIQNFYNGCPNCGTDFNIDYGLKKYGVNVHPIYGILEFFFIFSVLFIVLFPKIVAYLFSNDLFFIIFLLLLIIFCILALYLNNNKSIKIETGEIKLHKVINSLIFELNKFYYRDNNEENLVDFDILNYIKISDKEENGVLYIKIKYTIRKYFFIDNNIKKVTCIETAILKRNKTDILNSTINIKKCPNCGAPIDVLNKKCEYCNSEIKLVNKTNQWILEKVY